MLHFQREIDDLKVRLARSELELVEARKFIIKIRNTLLRMKLELALSEVEKKS